MRFRRIPKTEIQSLANDSWFGLTDSEVDEIHILTEELSLTMDRFFALDSPPVRRVEARRDPGRRPVPGTDPLNAVIRYCSVREDGASGVLNGRKVGIKDMFAVAGIPMTCGSSVFEGYTPSADSVAVERIMNAGGEIVAMLNMESWLFSGGGETSDYGSIRNPWDVDRTAGGSSGGSGAALFYGGIDLTFGTDQGGSIRIPASWCGVLGLKPTHGLIPYTGVVSCDRSFDHVGPLARDVDNLARGLAATAGYDWSDPRQRAGVPDDDYLARVSNASDDLKGVTLGILTEGFTANNDPDAPAGTTETGEAFREAVERFAELGATVKEISIPEHTIGGDVILPALFEGFGSTLRGLGSQMGFTGRYEEDYATAIGMGIRSRGDELPATVKVAAVMAAYFRRRYFGAVYAKAQNLRPVIADAYDRALAEVDFVLMPTTTHFAHRAEPNASLSERVRRGWGMLANTGTGDVTGHPALSMPAAVSGEFPVGVMAVARRFADGELIGLAATIENALGWFPKNPPEFPGAGLSAP